jgi:hemin uptake protein HemP
MERAAMVRRGFRRVNGGARRRWDASRSSICLGTPHGVSCRDGDAGIRESRLLAGLQVIRNCNNLAIVTTGDGNRRGGEIAPRVGAGSGGAPREEAGEPVIEAAQLMRGLRAIGIRHRGEIYRLRLTSNDKLILTK